MAGFIPDIGLHAINNAPRLANLIPGVDGVGPISEDPVTVTDSLNWLGRGFGLTPEYQPKTGLGKAVERMSEEIGAAALPAGIAVQQAGRMGKAGVSALRDLRLADPTSYGQGLAKMFLRPAAADAGRFVAQEVGIGAGAGLGAALTNALAGNEDRENPWIDLAGAVSGATATGLASAILPRVRDVFAAAAGSPTYASSYVKEGVAAQLAANSDLVAKQLEPGNLHQPLDTDPLVARLLSTPDVEEAVPNFRPTTAEAAGDFGLLNLENARSGADNAALYRARRGDNIEAVEDALRASVPSEPSSRFTAELGFERNRRLTDAELAALVASREADAASGSLAVTSTRPERGGAIREGIDAASEAAKSRVSEAYRASGAADVPVDPVAVRQRIDEAVASLSEVRKGLLPEDTIERVRRLGQGESTEAPTGLLDALGKPMTRPTAPPAPVRMDEVLSLRDELRRLQRAALADPRAERGGRNAAEAIGRVVGALDGYIDEALPPDQKAALDAARGVKFEQVDAFGRQGDPVAAAIAQREGLPLMRDDRVASTFAIPENIDLLFARAPSDTVRAAVKEEILSRGDFKTAAGAAAFKQKYAEQLRRFPGLADEIGKVVDARRASEGAQAGFGSLRRDIGPEGTGTVAKYLRYGDERADRAMQRIMDQPNPAAQVDELLQFVNDEPKAVAGARKAFWEVMEAKGRSSNAALASDRGTLPWAGGKWRAFMEDPGYQAVAQRLYRDDPEHWENVRRIEAALRELGERRAGAVATNPSRTTSSQRGASVSLAEVQAKYYEVARGRVNPLYMVTYLGTRIANRAVGRQSEVAFKRLLDEALLEPEVAAVLLKEFNPANRAALRRTAKAWIGNNGANLLDSLLDDEDQVEQAIRAR
ncbi:hypothetical protein D516_2691 [Rhodobacter sp. AKP1]|nr:hypothetical protein D516_2691 [Rhodobacter sp. AKP1]